MSTFATPPLSLEEPTTCFYATTLCDQLVSPGWPLPPHSPSIPKNLVREKVATLTTISVFFFLLLLASIFPISALNSPFYSLHPLFFMRLSMSSQDRRCSANDVGSATNPSKFSPSPLSDSVPSPSHRPSRSSSMALSNTFDVVVDTKTTSAPPSPSRRPGISPLQPRSPPPFLLVNERNNINRSLRICGFSSSRSTPTFPLSPTSSPSSPSTSNLKLPELEIPLLSPPHTPLALVDSPSTPCSLDVLSTCHFTPPPPSSSSNPSLRPRRQPLRSSMDSFTPAWIRGQGLEKEGYCSLCDVEGEEGKGGRNGGGGKWFRLKDGSYWYHRQFVHGISSINGVSFYLFYSLLL